VVMRTSEGEARAQTTLTRQVEKAEHSWKQKLWHFSNQRFARPGPMRKRPSSEK
jgi:hypothetical protein